MKIVYADKVQEIRQVLTEAAENKASHVAVTIDEMRAIVSHLRADTIFPEYMNKRVGEIKHLEKQQLDIKRRLNGNGLNDTERNQLFDREHAISGRLIELKREVPKELIAFNGIKVKSSINA